MTEPNAPTTIAATGKAPDAENVREVLEAAWNTIHGDQKAPWERLAFGVGRSRFRRFLDTEAYTDAALMLVPEGWQCVVAIFSDGSAEAILTDDRVNPVRLNDIERMGETPALAITLAALTAATGEA